MQVRLPKIDYSQVRPHWCPNHEFAHDRNASSTIPSYVEPYLIKVMQRAKKILPASETRLHREVDLFIAQESQHFRQHNGFNRRIREAYPGIAPFEEQLKRDLDGFLQKRSLKFNLAYSEGFETLGPPSAVLWFEHSDAMLEGADHAAVALWKWHMAEEFEHRDVCYRLFRALYAQNLWGRFANGWLYRVFGVWTAARHLGAYTKVVRGHMIAADRATMDEAGLAKSRANSKLVRDLAAKHMLPPLLKALSPFYNPAKKPVPPGLTAYLARFEKDGDMGLEAAAA